MKPYFTPPRPRRLRRTKWPVMLSVVAAGIALPGACTPIPNNPIEVGIQGPFYVSAYNNRSDGRQRVDMAYGVGIRVASRFYAPHHGPSALKRAQEGPINGFVFDAAGEPPDHPFKIGRLLWWRYRWRGRDLRFRSGPVFGTGYMVLREEDAGVDGLYDWEDSWGLACGYTASWLFGPKNGGSFHVELSVIIGEWVVIYPAIGLSFAL